MSTTYYLGPNHGRWSPDSWQDLVEAAAAGILDETSWVELKQAIPLTSKPANLELAKDLASLAVHGGLFVVGIEDGGEGKAGAVVGTDLTGLAQRIDQVARDRIHPPLTVRPTALEDRDGSNHGCVLVNVPASPLAPHMVDDRYWGRSSTGKRPLSDIEVQQLFEKRLRARPSIQDELRALAANDPIQLRHNGHLYVAVTPVSVDDDALEDMLFSKRGPEVVILAVESVVSRRPGGRDQFAPDLRGDLGVRRAADGLMLTSRYADDDVEKQEFEASFIECLVRSDGGVLLTCGRGTDDVTPRYQPSGTIRVVFFKVVLGLVYSTLALAGHLADEHSGFQGMWQVGVLMDRLRGVQDYDRVVNRGHMPLSYTAAEYERVCEASTVELASCPQEVTERLLARLVRGLGAEERYLPYR